MPSRFGREQSANAVPPADKADRPHRRSIAAPGAWLGDGSRHVSFLLSRARITDPAWAQLSQWRLQPAERRVRVVFGRRPSIGGSGGYSRPSSSAPVFGGSSPGDRAMSRGGSSEALRDYRASQGTAACLRAAHLSIAATMRLRPLHPGAAGCREEAGVRRCRGGCPRGAVAGIRSARGAHSALEW